MAIKQDSGHEQLPVLEHFYSIQGEGFHTGKAAYFVRMGGCDLGCRWCDSKDTWYKDLQKWTAVDYLLNEIVRHRVQAVLVTGGEPLMYNLAAFTKLCKEHGIFTHLETSGAHTFSGEWDWICLSPKPNHEPDAEYFSLASELKVIIYEETDFEWAEYVASKVGESCYLFLQPEWSRRRANTPKVVEYIKTHPKWRLSVQTHKYLKIP